MVATFAPASNHPELHHRILVMRMAMLDPDFGSLAFGFCGRDYELKPDD